MKVSLEWLGVATFRLRLDGMVVLLDTFMDRDPGAPQVGITTSQIDQCDYILVGHSHFDHLGGCERVARNTGAKIIGSHETVRLMRDEEVPEEQCVAVAGGERYRLSDDVLLTVYPSQHSCIWATMTAPGEPCLGDLRMTMQDRTANLAARQGRRQDTANEGERARLQAAARRPRPRGEGGVLAYLIDTPEGQIFWKDTSGHWTGIMRDIRPDVALLAAGGRGNVDGDRIQGSLAQFIAREVDLLRPKRVLISHHDSYQVGGENRVDRTVEPVREELSRQTPRVDFVNLPYLESYPLMRGL